MYDHINDVMTQRETELMAQVATLTQEREDWHRDASSHVQALCEKQAEVNGLEAQLVRTTTIIEALESLCHAVERGDTDFDYLRQLAQDGRWAITPPKEEV